MPSHSAVHSESDMNADYTDILGADMPYFYKNPSGTSSGALGRRDFVRPECIAMLNDAGGPRWSYFFWW